jgi:hypothetical protein
MQNSFLLYKQCETVMHYLRVTQWGRVIMVMAQIVKEISVSLSGAPHEVPTNSDTKLYNQNISLSSVTIPDVSRIPTSITL